MANDYVDDCRWNATATGLVDFIYSSAVTGYQSPANAGMVNGATYEYRAETGDLTQWENGSGVWTSSTSTLARTTITASSNAGAKVNFTSVPQVGITILSASLKSLLRVDQAQSLTSGQKTQGLGNLGVVLGVAANDVPQLDANAYLPISGAWTKLSETIVGSAVATVDLTFTSGFPAGFDTFCLEWVQLVPATTDVRLGLRLGTGVTPTWQTTGYAWGFMWTGSGASVNGQGSNDGISPSDRIGLTAGTTVNFGVGNDAGCHASGLCFFRKPNGSSLYPLFKLQSAWLRPTPGTNGPGAADGFGSYTTAAAITGLRMLFSSGNIASGTIRLWGIKS